MAEGPAHVRVRITHGRYDGERSFADPGSAKEQFWGPLLEIKRDRLSGYLTSDMLENTVRHELPERLRRRMIRFFRGDSGRKIEEEVSFPITVTFSYMTYGSLEFGLILEPIDKLAKLFDNNFDYLQAFFQMYLPLELNDVLQFAATSSSGPAEWGLISNLDYRVSVDPSMVAALAAMPTLAPSPAGGASSMMAATADRARWAWIAANTSLLVPTALAAVYLYFANQDLQERERRRPAEYQALTQEQTKLLDTCGALLTRYAPPSPSGKSAANK